MILFSVIIPVYNRAHLISETIDTVLAQTYPHFEIILVDDGSTDATQELIGRLYRNEPRVKYFYKENEERGAARNFGLKQARGEYAVFFDSDDWMKSHYLHTLAATISENPEIKLLAAKYDMGTKNESKINASLQRLAEGWYPRDLFLKGNILACNFCLRISPPAYKLFPEDRQLASMEDWLFLLQNMDQEKIFIRNRICLTMRQHDERSMSNNRKVIAARKNATAWALSNLVWNRAEKKTLVAWSHYFCGIHEYLDFNRRASVQEALAAIRMAGFQKKFIVLLAKSIAGRRFIKMIK